MPKRKADAALKKKGEEEAEDAAKKQTAGGGDEDDSEDDDDYEGEGGSEEGGSDDSDGDSDEGEGDEGEDEDESSGSGDSEDSFPSASSDEAESEDDEDGEAYKEIDCAFEFFDPQDRDFHGLRALLGTYLDGAAFDLSGLCECVIAQSAVGTVVKSAEDDDPFALLTAFNTARGAAAGATWLAELKAYLTTSCPEPALREKLEKAWSGPGTGLLVSERLINCPPQLAPPLLHFLMEEIEGAATDPAYPEAERSEFAFTRYLHFTRVYSDPQEEEGEEEDGEEGEGDKGAGPGPSGSMGPPPPKKPKTTAGGGAAAGAGASKGKQQQQPVIVYVRPEDEYLHQVCSWSYTFPVTSRPVAKGDLRPLRCVMCVEAGRVAEARAMMDLVVGNPMAGEEGPGAGGAAAAAPKQGQGKKQEAAAAGGRQAQGQGQGQEAAQAAGGNKGAAAAGPAGAKGKGKAAGGKAGGSGR
ncbi:hypothetical protein HYH02_015435 [Chlamydomonas schloesseri]|uniref:Protein BCCIP homolog n=1 Tax=Chlamydomonas schloesseri TaxID=2026947 RepID=A0A835VP32_9CHLO|nr:hypothetical protein HYH02_015435 [Chlamydomonas schloesseri]|eukprot:KAG2422485.1 hypothetical protein HYH02_015435 [Chlamydomonas schloesseri]